MVAAGERILIVESDPDISDLIARQALKPLGYDAPVVLDVASAIRQATENAPDLIIANLNLPDLSGTDLLTALASQGIRAPVIVVAEKGQEQRVIQAFRLGAADALFWPARDAEVVRVVERALQATRGVRARHDLDQQLHAMREELERKSLELATLLAIGKAVISHEDQQRLLGRLLEAAVQVGQADIAWFLVRDDHAKNFVLAAHCNLPAAWGKKLNQPLDDGLSSLVALSAQSLTIHGAPLEKFKIAALGKSAAVLPLRTPDEVVGLLIVVRKADREIEKNVQKSLEGVAELGTLSMLNGRLVRSAEQADENVRLSEGRRNALLESLRASVRDEIKLSMYPLEAMLAGRTGSLTKEQEQAVKTIQTSLKRLASLTEGHGLPVSTKGK
jgi:DNA-binding response OmpR family regulator